MTEKELSLYKSLQSRIERNKKKLEELRSKDIPVVSGRVSGSSRHFPYIETHFTVQMEEPCEAERCKEQLKKVENDIASDRARIKKIEEFINSIDDPELQLIFDMRVYKKMGWIDIAVELDEDKDRTTYSKRFKNYLCDSHNSHNSPIAH